MTPLEAASSSKPPVIGIGASAGGLEALQELLSSLPDEHNFALAIVQHLDPDHDSLLAELLGKRTQTPVVTVNRTTPIEGGHIYLIAPGQSLLVEGDTLVPGPFEMPRGRRRPIDDFLDSLARHQGTNAVGIILSGTGSDGTAGITAIKERGGFVFVQEPGDAKYDGMPRAAIDSGVSDLVLPAREMVSALQDCFETLPSVVNTVMSNDEFLARVTKHVRYRTGHDFSGYKKGTLHRRLAVRMSVLGISDPGIYVKRIVESSDEARRLVRDILINVTSFFRDRAVFDAIGRTHLPKLLSGRGHNEEFRIWVPGCSTGQEVYTLGMLALEALEHLDVAPQIAIFGSDIDEDALRIARQGRYPNSIVDEVPEDLLMKYFRSRQGGYEVSSKLRDVVRFSNQSLVRDPPFARIDMISCRNLLIYLDTPLQQRAHRIFQYALRERGLLVLGSSESLPRGDTLFAEEDRTHRVFRRKPGAPVKLDLPSPARTPADLPRHAEMHGAADLLSQPFAETLLKEFAPPFLHLSPSGDLLYASENAVRYLQMKPGMPELLITRIVRPEIEPTMRRVMSMRSGSEPVTRTLEGEIDGRPMRLEITRRMLPNDQQIIVMRDHLDRAGPADPSGSDGETPSAAYVHELETELEDARQTIRTTVEELETSNEELKSSNEEMMSMNEELQSSNEELSTTNDELNSKIMEIRKINADLGGFIDSAQIATVFLDDDLRIRRFTPKARGIFPFGESDIGRPFSDFGGTVDIDLLRQMCAEVIETGSVIEEGLDTTDGTTSYRVRIVPYSADGTEAHGVVFTLVDVTELRDLALAAEHSAEEARRSAIEIEALYHVSPQAMALLDADLRYLRINRVLAGINGAPAEAHIGKRLADMVPALAEQVVEAAQSVLDTGEPVEGLRVQGHTAGDEDERVWDTDWYPVRFGGSVEAVGLNVRDVTDQVRTAQELRRVMHELQHRVKNMLANVLALVNRTQRAATTDTALMEDLSKRIKALAGTHNLLTRSNWVSAPLRAILEPELTAIYGDERVTLRGPEINLNSRAVLSFGMAVHELATNAAKYGAFSNQNGSVSLTWMRQDDGERDEYVFRWRESGGPQVQPPDDGGFGSSLIRSTIEGSLEGNVTWTWNPDGLECVMQVPVNAVIENKNDDLFDLFQV
ncbi:chemotaxis protein CheB [Citreimonas salinaria]|uniref:Two-component system, chemotaxis family, CheB/CheR fusion protein n=1 Tax=Citreimonas salinaria TaxID=321339 RepID=A0A1H3IKL3_9RHOB|nr:chemotaxis protein CheB [Citreimonas salinaria]SDY28316.1 two-component system, chemotaxis family, CheB/CheR fusion protein [Citreimonas salinaria]